MRPANPGALRARRKKVAPSTIVLSIAVVLIALFILAPLIVVAVSSFTSAGYLTFPPQGFSFKWYGAIMQNPKFVSSFLTSAKLGVATMVISVVSGLLAAYAMHNYPSRLGRALEQVFLSPLMLPAVVLGLGLLFALSASGWLGTFLGALLAHVVIASPFVVRSCLAGLRSMDPRLEEASRSLGAGPVRTFMRVVVPAVGGSVASGAIFAFVISFDEAVVTLFLTGPHFSTLPVTIFTYVQYSNDPTVAAVSTVLIVFCVVLVWLMMRLSRSSARSAR